MAADKIWSCRARFRLHYGSDFPFTPWQACQYLGQQLEDSKHLDATTRDTIFLDNAYDLFRR